MASSIPTGFIDLYTASTKSQREANIMVNIMGIVTDVLPPIKSRGPDWQFSFSLADSTLGGIDNGFKVRFFKSLESEMPQIQGIGDVMILRNLKIMQWSGMTVGISSRNTSWTCFPASSIPKVMSKNLSINHLKHAHAPLPSESEMAYVVSLRGFGEGNSIAAPSSTIPTSTTIPNAPTQSSTVVSARREKFALIKDIQVDNFYDLVGQVVKLFPNNGRVELYITDYTTNSLLYNYVWDAPPETALDGRDGDEFNYAPKSSGTKKWIGPYGKQTLTITLWPPHSEFAEANVEGMNFVYLRNVRIKFSKDGKIEGSLHTDNRNPDRIDVQIIKRHEDDERVKNVLRRKLEYSKKFQLQSQQFINEARGLKRKEEDRSLSRGQKSRKRRRQKAQEKEDERDEILASICQGKEGAKVDENNNIENDFLSKSLEQELNKNSM